MPVDLRTFTGETRITKRGAKRAIFSGSWHWGDRGMIDAQSLKNALAWAAGEQRAEYLKALEALNNANT